VPEAPILNYPDLLGYITNGARFNTGVVQAAMAMRPRVVRSGRPFEVILIVQNASDADVDVTATVTVPDVDAAKKKGRFIIKVPRLVVGLKPSEVGYVVLPVTTMPDTAVSADYKISVDIKAQPVAKAGVKPQRTRAVEGGGEFDVSKLANDVAQKVSELKNLTYITQPKNRLTGGNTLETPFSLMAGKLGEIADIQPGWVSLWTLNDFQDDRMLLHRHRDTMQNYVLPKFKRANLFPPLLDATNKRFEKAGYKLNPIEAQFIAKLLTLLLEYAAPSDSAGHSGLAAGDFNLIPLLDSARLADPRPITLPYWVSSFLRLLNDEPRAAEHPVEAIARIIYPELVRDGILYAFKTIEQTTGEELGNDEEMQQYAENVINTLNGDGTLDFTHTYIPLVMGGLMIFDSVIMPGEKLDEMVNNTNHMLEAREKERNEDSEVAFNLTHRLIGRAMAKYGYREG
jgi:hypothetical protein